MGWMLNCKQVHRLTSEGMDRDLTLAERTRLRAHLLLCDGCHNFTGQMQLLRQAMHALDRTHQPARTGGKDETWQ